MEEEPRKKKRRGYAAHLDGKALVLSHDAPLVDVCMKCGSHDGITRREVVFSWSPVWVRYLVFCLIGVLLQLIMRVRASVVVPLCAPCNARWSHARYATIGSIVALVAALVAATFLQDTHPQARFLGPGLFAAVLGFLLASYFFLPRPGPTGALGEAERTSITVYVISSTLVTFLMDNLHSRIRKLKRKLSEASATSGPLQH